MDAAINRIPLLIDAAGQSGVRQTASAATGTATLAQRLRLEDLKGTILTTVSNSDPDYASAFANASAPSVRATLQEPLAAFDGSLRAGRHRPDLSRRQRRVRRRWSATMLGHSVRSTGMTLDAATLPVIAQLLDSRIAGFNAASTRTELIALIAVLIALYLFAGFYLAVRRSSQTVLDGVEQLREQCADRFAEGLTTMATGDLTRRLSPVAPEIECLSSDELGEITAAVDMIRQRVLGAISSFNEMSDRLSTMITGVSASAMAVSAASVEVSSSSEEAGRATAEIAEAIGDVAQGSERQVEMLELVRRATDEVVGAVGQATRTRR